MRKASPAERAAYAATKPVYPLYGYIRCDGRLCAIEDLRGAAGDGEPKYEVVAPTGFHFDEDGTHTLLCYSIADVRHRVECNRLAPCTARCG